MFLGKADYKKLFSLCSERVALYFVKSSALWTPKLWSRGNTKLGVYTKKLPAPRAISWRP